MTVSSQDTVFQHVGNGVTTVFAYGCQVPTATDLEVYLDDVLQTSGFSIAGLGAPTGGTVTFSVAPANLVQIRIERVIELERTTDYQQNGDFLSRVVNPDFDRIWMALQGHLSTLKRAMLFPKSDTVLPNPLPAVADRANKLLSFDASGQPVAIAPSDQSSAALVILLASSAGSSMIGRNEQVVDSVATLRTLSKNSASKYARTTGYYVHGDGGAGGYYYDSADTTSTDNGGTVIVAADGGRWKLIFAGAPTLRQFGAKGDNSTNDSAAILAARDYIIGTGNNVVVTPGTYLSDPFSVNSQAYAGQANFIGTDRERCIFKRRTTGVGAFITLGAVNGTAFQAGVGLKYLTVDGGAQSNGDAFLGYDVVRTTFEEVRFTGGAVGTRLFGGVSINFLNCLWEASIDGLRIDKFTSLAGGGWPNLIRVMGGEIVDCPGYGLYFDNGRMLILDNVEVENNGTTLAAFQGGVYIGPNVGAEISVTDTYSIGLIAKGCWFEANKGRADIVLESGINYIGQCNFFSTPAQSTNDFLVNGGRYTIEECNCSFSKTNNLFENPGVLSGNLVKGSDVPNFSIDQSKTMVFGSNRIVTRGGIVPVFADHAVPFEQFGNNSTPGGGTVDITFLVPFASGSVPRVFIEVNNGDSATSISQPCVSNLTRFGFRVRILSIGTGSSTISSISAGFNWRAVGTL